MLDTLEKGNIKQYLREMKIIKKVSLFSSSRYSAEAGRGYKFNRGNELFPLLNQKSSIFRLQSRLINFVRKSCTTILPSWV